MIQIVLLIAIALLATVSGFTTKISLTTRRPTVQSIVMKDRNSDEMNTVDWKNILSPSLTKSISALLCGAALLANPSESLAARSGGRSGGSSFRSAPRSAPSSTRLNSGGYSGGTRSSYRPSPIVIMPSYSPFGFSPFGGFGMGFSPFSFFPSPSVLFLGLAAYAAYTLLTNRAGGSDFSNDGDGGSLGSGASVMKLQISMSSDWAKNGNIMQTLSDLSQRGSVTGRNQISSLLSDASLSILRKNEDWTSACFDSEAFNSGGGVEPTFQRLAVSERAKFETEISGSSVRSSSIVEGSPTEVVVSIIVAIRGKSDALKKSAQSVSGVKQILQTFASEALTDEGDNIMGVEILWTPSEPGETLSERDIVSDYPELMRI